MIVRNLEEVRRSDWHVRSKGWESTRLCLARDKMGFSFHITTIYEGAELPMHYKNHLESVYCIAGEGSIEDLATGETHEIRPGVIYLLNEHDRHILRAKTEMTMACGFNPPVTGQEVHDETGAYPAAPPDQQ